MVRFSESKESKRKRSDSRSVTDIPQELIELRKAHAHLKIEVEALTKQLQIQDDYQHKYKELKLKYKTLSDNFKKSEVARKELKEIASENKKTIMKLKKKNK